MLLFSALLFYVASNTSACVLIILPSCFDFDLVLFIDE
jgi:hypothetical protein